MMEQLFYIFCTTLPSHIIPFVLFWNFQWRSRKAALLVMGASVLCKLGAAAWCITSGVEIRSMEIVFSALNFLLYWYFLRLDFFKLLFTYLLIVDYLLVIRGIAAFLAVRFCQAPPQGWMGSLFCTALYLLTLPPLLRDFRRVSGQVYHTGAPHIWQTIWLVPAILSALTILSTNAWAEQSAGSWLFLAYRGGLLACVLVICYVLLQAIDSLQKQIALEQRLTFERELLEMQMEEEEKRGLLLMETAEQTRQMRHDLRHHLTAIQAMAGDENPRLAAYLSELIRDIPAAVRDYCENPTVNAVVSHYAARCQQEGIAFAARLTVPARNKNLDDRALCVVFANLLGNAVEACWRMDGGEKFIRLNSSLEYGVLTITMDNSFDGQARQEDGKFLSSKRAGAPGVGLSSIRAVAKAHQGDARFEADGQVFRSSVYLSV